MPWGSIKRPATVTYLRVRCAPTGLLVSGLDALPSGYNSRPGSAALLRKVGAAEVPERSQHILPANSERLPVVPIHGCHVRRSSGSGRALEAMSRDSRRARGKRAT